MAAPGGRWWGYPPAARGASAVARVAHGPLIDARVECHHVGGRRLHPAVTTIALPLLSFVPDILDALHAARGRTLHLVRHLTPAELERQLDPIMSPLVWDLAHIAAYEDLWLVHRHAGEPLLHDELAAVYDAFETPRAVRGDDRAARHGGRARLPRGRCASARSTRSTGAASTRSSTRWSLRHELQHTETMLPGDGARRPARVRRAGGRAAGPGARGHTRPGVVDVPGGRVRTSAPHRRRFAYDNERPRHAVEVAPFRIARTPGHERDLAAFAEGGGYERREWWSDEGWAWKEEYDITHPGAGSGDRTDRGRAHAARTRDLAPTGPSPTSPGSRPTPSPARTAHACRPRPSGRRRRPGTGRERRAGAEPGRALDTPASAAAAPRRCRLRRARPPRQRLGVDVDRRSTAIPGFVAHPYREYSEVFFGDGYRVLRGGSWATAARASPPHLPQLGPARSAGRSSPACGSPRRGAP